MSIENKKCYPYAWREKRTIAQSMYIDSWFSSILWCDLIKFQTKFYTYNQVKKHKTTTYSVTWYVENSNTNNNLKKRKRTRIGKTVKIKYKTSFNNTASDVSITVINCRCSQ